MPLKPVVAWVANPSTAGAATAASNRTGAAVWPRTIVAMPLIPTFTTLGDGPPVLLLHGSGGGYRAFAPQVESLASLGFRALAWDMPGYGHSAPIEPYGRMGLAASCVALIEALAPLTGGAPLAVVGQGLGGLLAQELALRRPDLVRQLVLVATAAQVQDDDAYGHHIAQGLAWLDQGKDMERIADLLLPRLASPLALPAGLQLARWCQSQVPAPTWRRALEAMRGFDRRAALAGIHVPVLVLAGEHDRVTPPDTARMLAEAIVGSRCVILRGAGHLPQLEQPEAFDAALIEFLRQAPPPLH